MNNNVDKFLGIANKAKRENGLGDDYCALIPMLRKENDKLYVVVLFTKSDAKVWSKDSNLVPEYWCLIDSIKMEKIQFNKTSDKSFTDGDFSLNSVDDSFNKEVSKYVVNTKMKYKDYIENDIKNNDLLSYQKEVIDFVDDKNISLNDYFYANLDNEINEEIDKLVDLIATSKYNSLTTYYDCLFTNIINEYTNSNVINNDKINLACKMMNTYYQGLCGIDNIFNK